MYLYLQEYANSFTNYLKSLKKYFFYGWPGIFFSYSNMNTRYIITCCVFQPANAWSKTIENTWKWAKKYLFHHAHQRLKRGQKNEEKRRKKGVLDCFRPCERMRKHACTGRNTQQSHMLNNYTKQKQTPNMSFLPSSLNDKKPSIDRVWLKSTLQVIIPFIFLLFLLTLSTSTLAKFKIEQKSIVHLKINYYLMSTPFWQYHRNFEINITNNHHFAFVYLLG